MDKIRLIVCVLSLLVLWSCATSNHGTFVTSTYVEQIVKTDAHLVGTVIGESRQSWFLYLFPLGEAPSTSEAILNAKSKIEGTKFLTDISIDDRTYWRLGYSQHVIKVEATAYK